MMMTSYVSATGGKLLEFHSDRAPHHFQAGAPTQYYARAPVRLRRLSPTRSMKKPLDRSSSASSMPRIEAAAHGRSARIMMPSTSETMPESSTQPQPGNGRSPKA